MSRTDDEITGEEPQSIRDRVAAAANAAASLVRTRLAIFGEELSIKAALAGKGLAAAALAGALGVGMLLLLAALLAAIFAALFHSLILGILTAMLLYGAGAGLLAWKAWTTLSQVRPTEFRATATEIAKDLAAVRSALECEEDPGSEALVAAEPDSGQIEDLERRLRAGAD